MSSFEAQPEARDSITLAFEALGRPVVSDEDWHALLKLLKEAKVVASDFDERVMKAVWQRKGGGRKFTHVELRSGVFEEYSRPRRRDGGRRRRRRCSREEEERHKAFKKAHAAEARGKSSGRFDYSANWGHIAESDEDSERDDDMEKASSYIENHRRRGNAKFEAGEYQAAMQQYTAALLKYAEQTWKIEKKTKEGRADYAAVAWRSLPDDEALAKVHVNRVAVLLKIIAKNDGDAHPLPPPAESRLPAFSAAKPLDPYKLVQKCFPSKYDRLELLRCALQDAERAVALHGKSAKTRFRRAQVLRLCGRATEAHRELSAAFPLAPEDHVLCLELASMNADFHVAYEQILETKQGIRRGQHALPCLFGRKFEEMKNVDLSQSKHGDFMRVWAMSYRSGQREAHIWSVLKKADELTEELHQLIATIGSVEFLFPGCFVEGDWMPNLFFCFMWNDTDRADWEVKKGKKEKIKQKEERLAPGTFGKRLFEKVLNRDKTVLFDFDVDDEFQRPLIRVATRLFRYQVVLSFCVELIKEVVGEAGHEPVNAREELIKEWKQRGLYVERAEYNYKPPPKQMR
ncbi:hypothetical protein JL722_4974 [Aureococcus anophagefferens]|nr:hypothetical protein JL722_4974 [Aureococcus anophagefferens]